MGELENSFQPILLRYDAAELAYATVVKVMVAAEKSDHTPGSWTKEGDQHHVAHMKDHVRYQPDRDDLEHTLCRAAMALWSLDNGVLGNNGAEGNG